MEQRVRLHITHHTDAPILFRTWQKSINPFLCSHNSLQSFWKAFHWMLEHGCRDLWPFRSARYMPLMGKRWLAVSVPTDPVAVQIQLKNNKSCVYTTLSVMYIVLTDWLIELKFNAHSDGTTRGRPWTFIELLVTKLKWLGVNHWFDVKRKTFPAQFIPLSMSKVIH